MSVKSKETNELSVEIGDKSEIRFSFNCSDRKESRCFSGKISAIWLRPRLKVSSDPRQDNGHRSLMELFLRFR